MRTPHNFLPLKLQSSSLSTMIHPLPPTNDAFSGHPLKYLSSPVTKPRAQRQKKSLQHLLPMTSNVKWPMNHSRRSLLWATKGVDLHPRRKYVKQFEEFGFSDRKGGALNIQSPEKWRNRGAWAEWRMTEWEQSPEKRCGWAVNCQITHLAYRTVWRHLAAPRTAKTFFQSAEWRSARV